ncbi:glycosyltransferase [Caballeronia sp. J97]|uniref:glycosyltransferase n=1 Tax=Caballeronia sp. J97 TaxID=2805429 RepID=UPI002AB1C292|nr:glycosyltransferase [Caballeronia sp. J97]
MAAYPVFLSVVVPLHNEAATLANTLRQVHETVCHLVRDYEIIVIDNASDDESIERLKCVAAADGIPNLQVFALTKPVDADTVAWIGLENALGDFVVVLQPMADDIGFVPQMLSRALAGTDVVFALNTSKPRRTSLYGMGYAAFNKLYKWSSGIDLLNEAPEFRLLSKKVITFILQHPRPALAYRSLPVSGGFTRAKLTYSKERPCMPERRRVLTGLDHGIRLLVSTTRAPMRLVTALSLFGAFSNVIYSGYVIVVAMFKTDVAPGWVTLSLQQSGMFLLISLVLLVLGEYIIQIARISNEGPFYHVAQEFNSAVMTHADKLNIDDEAISEALRNGLAYGRQPSPEPADHV